MSNVSVILDKKLNIHEEEVLERFKEFQEAIIKKDAETLDEIMDDEYILTHMSGKTQTKAEYISEIMDGTLNYYKSTIIHPQISIFEDDYAKIIADVELDAKVYGIKGTWTLNTNISMKKMNNKWFLNQWEN
jgi:DNA-binding Lrp family transcriptional regulator